MNNSAAKVGEIFTEAGAAFNRLAEMTMQLHPMVDSPTGSKWTDEEIEMLRNCVHQFASDLNKLSQHIKNRTVSQIRATLKKKAFEDAGIPVRQISSSGQSQGAQQQSVSQNQQQSLMGKSAEVTLNMLNAHDPEVDVEGLSGDVKLEFETSPDGKLEFETGTEEVTG
ncbi:BPTF-associated chromatin complex component 1 isoform X2 [Arctopsyche grandis]|uniref:BPTF-associated chromatin complex component 1 isoform X2 n=1 Tax=Arctopsyche grandis TaxID=121162 RepID=UPI00406D82B1